MKGIWACLRPRLGFQTSFRFNFFERLQTCVRTVSRKLKKRKKQKERRRTAGLDNLALTQNTLRWTKSDDKKRFQGNLPHQPTDRTRQARNASKTARELWNEEREAVEKEETKFLMEAAPRSTHPNKETLIDEKKKVQSVYRPLNKQHPTNSNSHDSRGASRCEPPCQLYVVAVIFARSERKKKKGRRSRKRR
ncbi:hypothetical protein BC567DRAFT_77142 [Phyllosticta citribraziliensis]